MTVKYVNKFEIDEDVIFIEHNFANVKDYGAVGDGVSIDNTYINNAINEISANGGGILYMPQGTYLIGSPIVLKDNVKILGDNAIIKAKNNYDKTYVIRALGGNNIEIDGLIIDGNKDNTNNLVKNFFKARKLIIRNCEFKNFNEYNPIQVHDSFDVYILDNIVHDSQNCDCIAVSGSDRVKIDGNHVYNFDDTGIVSAAGSTNVSITNNVIQRGTYTGKANAQCIAITDGHDIVVSKNLINNNGKNQAGIRVYKDPNTRKTPSEVVISDNIINNTTNGIAFGSTKEIVISSNIFNNVKGWVIRSSDVENGIINDNLINEFENGILIEGSTVYKNIQYSNNLFKSSTITPIRCIFINVSGASTLYENNVFINNTIACAPSNSKIGWAGSVVKRSFKAIDNVNLNHAPDQYAANISSGISSGATINHDYGFPVIFRANDGTDPYFTINGKNVGNNALIYPDDVVKIYYSGTVSSITVTPR